MENKDYRIFDTAFGYIGQRKLCDAIRAVRPFLDSHPNLMPGNTLDGIAEDYRRMLDYAVRGFKDPECGEVYNALLRRMYVFLADMRMEYRIQNERFFIEAFSRSRQYMFSHDLIKSTLENFVTDLAMLSLEPGDDGEERERMIYSEHQKFIALLFDYIVVSKQWKQTDRLFFEDLLLSPMIDTNDALLLVSAITLANVAEFDINKFTVLVHVYSQATFEPLRQRALVGWAFSMRLDIKTMPEQEQLVEQACGREETVKEIIDFQKQIIYCMNAEKDNEKIQRDIIPTIMRNNNFNITKEGIFEKDEDPMEDIMQPDAADRRMEEMEEGMQKMINMQKSGSDIYFGGFSQMKRFPFFYTLSNWFIPFYIKHPDLKQASGKLGSVRLMSNLLNNGPFCESDKYSFAIAISTIIDRIPEGMRDMLGNAEAMGPLLPEEQQRSGAYIRRMYLQDLYRFFRLHPYRNALDSPFGEDRYIFISGRIYSKFVDDRDYADLALFFHKHHDGNAMGKVLGVVRDSDSTNVLLLKGIYESVYRQDDCCAAGYYRTLIKQEPENEQAMARFARVSMNIADYTTAMELYGRLSKMNPEKKVYALNHCIALTKNKLYDEAVTALYRLDYECPDDINVIRVLAWALMGQNRLEQAEKEYSRLLSHASHNGGDYLNAGYCQWFKGNISQAVSSFSTFLKYEEATDIDKEFSKDRDILEDHGLSWVEVQLMVDIVGDFR